MPKIRITESATFDIDLNNYKNIDENGKNLTDLTDILHYEHESYQSGDLQTIDLEQDRYEIDLLDDEGKVMKTIEWRKGEETND